MHRLLATVPGTAARRTLVDAVIPLIVEIMFGKRRDGLRIGQRGHGAYAKLPPVAAAALHWRIIRRPESPPRIVAGGTCHSPRGRQGRIEEQRPPDIRHCRRRGYLLEGIGVERRVGACR